jgi:pilus assembly protein Flp/PilA
MKNVFIRFLSDESGATSIEYSLLVACISLAVLSSVNAVGKQLSTKLAAVSTSLH